MRAHFNIRPVFVCVSTLVTAVLAARLLATSTAPVAVDSVRITVSGTSNIHPYTASTTSFRVRHAELASIVAGDELWNGALRPGGVEAFEVAIPAASLTSPREGLDKNMHKALKVQKYPEIVFHLVRLEPAASGAVTAIGTLRIAGVEREIAFDLKTERNASVLTVKGEVQLLMTDYGIKPPTAMLGMLKTDPKVTIAFETVLSAPRT